MVSNIYKLCFVHKEMFQVDKHHQGNHPLSCLATDDKMFKMFIPTGLEAEVRFGSVGHST